VPHRGPPLPTACVSLSYYAVALMSWKQAQRKVKSDVPPSHTTPSLVQQPQPPSRLQQQFTNTESSQQPKRLSEILTSINLIPLRDADASVGKACKSCPLSTITERTTPNFIYNLSTTYACIYAATSRKQQCPTHKPHENKIFITA